MNAKHSEAARRNLERAGLDSRVEAIANHPKLESIILPTFKNKLEGISISIVK